MYNVTVYSVQCYAWRKKNTINNNNTHIILIMALQSGRAMLLGATWHGLVPIFPLPSPNYLCKCGFPGWMRMLPVLLCCRGALGVYHQGKIPLWLSRLGVVLKSGRSPVRFRSGPFPGLLAPSPGRMCTRGKQSPFLSHIDVSLPLVLLPSPSL